MTRSREFVWGLSLVFLAGGLAAFFLEFTPATAQPRELHPVEGGPAPTAGAASTASTVANPLPVASKRGVKATALPPPATTPGTARPLPVAKQPPPPANTAAGTGGRPAGAYVVLGSFSDARQARCFAAGFQDFKTAIAPSTVGDTVRYRVVAPGADRPAAEALRDKARAAGAAGAWILAACTDGGSGIGSGGTCLDRSTVSPASGSRCPQSASSGG